MEELEEKLDSFDGSEREEALRSLWGKVQRGEILLPQPGSDVNMHSHTFFSYNSYGYSPSKVAWLSRKRGLGLAGIVDFDVLDGLREFYGAGELIGLKTVVGMETRVFVPEFADKEITSPGEPGVSYHMGVGFPRGDFEGELGELLSNLKENAQRRNAALMERVNEYLAPVVLDYEKDVIALTPAGNPTERHICLAYARKAASMFGQGAALAEFWSEKLSVLPESLDLPEGRDLLNTIRAKTMKRGGVGYVQPDQGSFPEMAAVNRFALEAGAIPTHTWLNGLSAGEQEIEKLLEVAMSTGVAALNIIPDRNYTPGQGKADAKLVELYKAVDLAEQLHLPVVVGTEMNSPGQKFVDNFETAELKPLVPIFLKGAHIVFAHTVLQRSCGLGYTSQWSNKNFPDAASKNEFFEQVGKQLKPLGQASLRHLDEGSTPGQVLKTVSS